MRKCRRCDGKYFFESQKKTFRAPSNYPVPAQPGVIFCRNLDELEKVLSNAALYIGNDSGASHFASFIGIPTIAIYKSGATNPALWGTFGKRSVNILAEDEDSAMGKILKSANSMNIFYIRI